MNFRKKMLIVIPVIIFLALITVFQTVVSAKENGPVYFGITYLRYRSGDMGYGIHDPRQQGGNFIWGINRYASATPTSPTAAAAYCLKSGFGFEGMDQDSANKVQLYDEGYDLLTEKDIIKTKGEAFQNIIGENLTGGAKTSQYNNIVGLLDLMYVPGKPDTATANSYKESLLTAAVNEEDEEYEYSEFKYKLTDDDIEAVQQAALWYFTNFKLYGDSEFDLLSSDTWLTYTQSTSGNSYTAMSDYSGGVSGTTQQRPGWQRDRQAMDLCKYLIKHAQTHSVTGSGSVNVTADSLSSKLNSEKTNYVIGPFNVTANNANIGLTVKRGETDISTSVKIATNAEGTNIVTSAEMKNGGTYYLVVPVSGNEGQKLSIKFNSSYQGTKMTVWVANSTNNEQPIVELDKSPKQDFEFEITPETPKELDLALRKYIVQIDGSNVQDSRTPSINSTELSAGRNSTAEYKHRKDPVEVTEGAIVTYNITIYNEGSEKGRANQVIDQLPTGLELIDGSDAVSGNFELEQYDKSSNKVILKRKSLPSDEWLDAYSGSGDPDFETITLKCKVTATASAEADKILTNVAWISKEEGENTPEFTDANKDRDSAPSTAPNVNQNTVEPWRGTDNSTDLASPDHYFPGQQDDDDFEKLVIKKNEDRFDLKLIKRITEVNGEGIPERIQNVDSSKLNSSGTDSKTTAEYTLDKNAVKVEKGDIVTYTFRIYNEGYIDGYAEQIKENVPSGLKFIWSEDEDNDESLSAEEKAAVKYNKERDWKPTSENNIIVSDHLSRAKSESNLIKAFGDNADGSKNINDPQYYKELSVKFKVTDEAPIGERIRNDACISEDADKDGKDVTDRDSQPENWPKTQDDEDYDNVIIGDERFDLKLIKRIVEVNGSKVPERILDVDSSKLNTSASDSKTTADYELEKDPVKVEKGDLVKYTFRIYNEGYIDGYAEEITENIPTGLDFVWSDDEDNDANLSAEEKAAVKFNKEMDWSENSDGTISSNHLSKAKSESNLIKAFGENPDGSKDIDDPQYYKELSVIFKVANSAPVGTVIRNDACVSEDADSNGKSVDDRDSQPENWPKTQDDEDYDNVIIETKDQPFDLKLIKRIVEVNGEAVEERIKSVDVSRLNTPNGTTTANYNLNKDPVKVEKGDLVKYTFRVYNEGYIDGYAEQITEDIPEGLEFIWSDKKDTELEADDSFTPEEKEAIKFNQSMYWTYGKTMNEITTDYLSKAREVTPGDNLIKAFGENDGKKTEADLHYKEVSVIFKVKDSAVTGSAIRNEACISKDADKDGNDVTDRDSKPEDWKKYEDDEDYDNVILENQEFDLALRKFIIAVTRDIEGLTSLDDLEDSDSARLLKEGDKYIREPQVDTSKLNTEVGGKLVTTADYNHPKDPVQVTVGDYVVYMLRVYNEGSYDGYAPQIADYLPEYLEYVDCDFNKNYGWAMPPAFWTEDQTGGEAGDNICGTEYLKDKKIAKAEKTDNGYTLSYQEVPILCRVKDSVQPQYKITNIAEIAKYEDENHEQAKDRDSEQDNVNIPDEDKKPSYKDNEKGSYVPGQEDDDDFEKVVVDIFDLALRKWVSEVIVVEDGQEYRSQTGHQPYDDPEDTVKVELNRKKLNSTEVKFKYGIRIINEENIAGYAKEIKDYIPEGLEFHEEDNPEWTYLGNNIAVTDQLADTLLQPGDYVDIEIILTWIKGEDNLGLKENNAEISEDYNDLGIPDVDSKPDNYLDGEDDIDDAPVILSIVTGGFPTYLLLTTTVLGIFAGGIYLIKKYVIK